MDQRKLLGWIGAGCGGALFLLTLASAAFFIYVGVEGSRSDGDVAWPATAGSCCCGLMSLAFAGIGVYFALSRPKSG